MEEYLLGAAEAGPHLEMKEIIIEISESCSYLSHNIIII